MAETYKRRYGLDWPHSVSDIYIDLILAKKWKLEPYKHGNLLDPGEHMVRAIKALFTPEQWTVSPWTEQHAHAWAAEDFSVWLGAASTGKAQSLDSQVLTPTGPRTMGELQIGDEVIGRSGKPVKITATHDAGVRPEYRVVAADGRESLCADTHLWSVYNRDLRFVPVVKTIALIPDKHLLPEYGPVEYTHSPVKLNPYLLGVLLGDGTLGAASGSSPLSITNTETTLLAKVTNELPAGYELVYTKKYTWRIVKKSRENNGSNVLIQEIKDLGLWAHRSYERFIPTKYKVNSIAVRQGVLAGLLDTDGTVSTKGGITYTSTSKQLAIDVIELVRSLGGRASLTEKLNSGYKKDGVKIICRPSYNVYISLPDMLASFLFPGSPMKRGRLVARRAFKRSSIARVEPTGRIVPMKCITVDAPDGLYLTGSFMPTHNSNDAGGLAVLDWITDPFETYIALASTSVPMLKLRSFESVTRYFRALKKNPQFLIPGKESASMTAIINDNDSDDGDATSKASIRGVALADGDESKAVARLAGAHLPYVTIILDEGSALPAAAAKARFNAAAGAKRFRFLSLANPVSQFDEATKFCVPIDGWASVGPDSDSWRSKYGLVLHHNGFKSPAITEPDGENKYPFLINQPQIDRMLNEVGGNTDDPMIWCMVAGFPTPQGVESTVLAPVDLTAFHARETAVWREGVDFIDVAGADPAFVSEGDGCIMQRARVGVTREGLYSISFFPPDKIPIGVSAPRPGAYQAADGIIALAHEHHIPISSIAVDDSGTQSVCDILEVEAGKKPIRCNFASRSTEMEAVDGDKVPRPKYRNLVTELWHQVARLVRENQVRDLPEAAAAQLCSRRYRRDVKPLTLEGKKDYKKRQVGQRSPDEADALALCCFAAMRVAGLHPGKPRRYVATNTGQVVPGSNSAMRSPSVDYTRGMDDTPMSSYMNSGGRI